jgi:hypothetical protein
MTVLFSQYPGRRERHLLRKRDNPLFPPAQRNLSTAAVQEAQRRDHDELVGFITDFRKLIHEAVNLKPNDDSEVILGLKERLDQAFERAAGLADDQTETKNAIKKLTAAIMAAVRNGAAGDPAALLELEQEEQARRAHFGLLEHPLVADLLHPESPIEQRDLVATLLSASRDELDAALTLFDQEQLALLYGDGEALLASLADAPQEARERLDEMLARCG